MSSTVALDGSLDKTMLAFETIDENEEIFKLKATCWSVNYGHYGSVRSFNYLNFIIIKIKSMTSTEEKRERPHEKSSFRHFYVHGNTNTH